MKRILITGANSYIGTSFEKWMTQWPDSYYVDTVSTRDGEWEKIEFSGYDVVLHVAGIVHTKETKKNENLYYSVNRDLSYEIAEKSKANKVKQFIYLSSMSVYGLDVGMIDNNTVPNPKNHYGKSKIEGEKCISSLENDSFRVAIIRPPMVYGKGCKGNYARLAKFVNYTPIFPIVDNQRSMIFIDNLCEFIRLLIANCDRGVFCPQNNEYVNTSEIVTQIAKIRGKYLWKTKLFNLMIYHKRNNLFNKVFGSLIYDRDSFRYYRNDYNIVDFSNSIRLIEEGE